MKQSFGPQAIAYPLPVFLVGTYDRTGKPDVMVAAWGGICSSDPPSIAVSIRPMRKTFKNLKGHKDFTISIPSEKIVREADFFGIVSGETTDKFAKSGLTPVKAENVNAPYVAECPVILECRVIHRFNLGAHTQFVGEILDTKIDVSVLGEDNKPDRAKMMPLMFDVLRSEYYVPGPVIGKAFSAGKKFIS